MATASVLAQIAGAAIVVAVLAEAGIALVAAWRRADLEVAARRLALKELENRVERALAKSQAEQRYSTSSWRGYRKFEVAERIVEAPDVVSLRLVAHDRRALAAFKPGQYLTFRLALPGRGRPIVRCYSLSAFAAEPLHYQITVKRIPAPADRPDLPAGAASGNIHDRLAKGDIIDIAAPTGNFVLDPDGEDPVVLLAGGIGITPIACMLGAIAESARPREVQVFYGVSDLQNAVFREQLRALVERHPQISLRLVCSQPSPHLVEGRDYNRRGHVTVELLKRELPSNNYQFFICGPSAMLSQMTRELAAWGVPEEHIHYEVFSSASVQRTARLAAAADSRPLPVVFERSGKTLTWTPTDGSLLDLALAHEIAIDYGCRAGNCGTCLTAIRDGEVSYLSRPGTKPEAGSCLPCIAIPKTTVTLSA